jgi:hypothetical protein
MTLRFSYAQGRAPQPLVWLGGRQTRPRPLVSVTVVGPKDSVAQDALLDTGADDTVFPEWVAAQIGVDLANAPTATGAGLSGAVQMVRFAQVTLRLADNFERREWLAWVGFTSARMRHPMLGFAGFLQYFTVTFHGEHEEVELTVNGLYPGT